MFAGQVEDRIEGLCLAFENAKPYLENNWQSNAGPRRPSMATRLNLGPLSTYGTGTNWRSHHDSRSAGDLREEYSSPLPTYSLPTLHL